VALRQEEFTSLCDDVDLDRDRALVERCQAGDSAAFGNLYARYYERLLRFCLRRLNDRHEAEDAAQEAFARAWKALPNFAGERRFYPWLTVIAGNICTDMLRRRSRSTPTDDLELSGQRPVGVSYAETSDEVILAAVDGELVNKALDRLSVRHRHVLAMREGSGWTYQQIADHEGVEIGTIETLLWRARQALKREFTVLSESKSALGGFLIGTGALIRRSVFRVAHRTSVVQQNAGMGSGGLRNALAGVAVTSAAVAAALITPHALSSSPNTNKSALSAPAEIGLADPGLPIPTQTATPATTGGTSSNQGDSETSDSGSGSSGVHLAPGATKLPSQGDFATAKTAPPSIGGNGPQGPLSTSTDDSPLAAAITPVAGGLTSVANGLVTDVNSLATNLGLGGVLSIIGLTPSTPAGSTTTSTTTPGLLGGVTNTVHSTLNSILGKG
jgi:RNA polymerase sigma-70 factor (ECF subfamily)